jgi:thiol-disulfide isomerase/thioredoxin
MKKINFNKYTLAVITILLLAISINATGQAVKKVKIEELESYINSSSRPMVISFWATWCAPCVKEIPWIQSAVENRKADSVEYILVSLDFEEFYPKKLTDFIVRQKFNATHFWLNETNADHFCPRIHPRWSGGLPANLFVNNKTGYRRFFERQLTDRQAVQEVAAVIKGQ